MKCIGAVFHTWCCLTALKALKTAQPGDALESHSSFDMLALAKLGTVWPKNVSAKEFEPSNSQKSPSLAPEALHLIEDMRSIGRHSYYSYSFPPASLFVALSGSRWEGER